MKRDKIKWSLTALAIQSFLALGLAALFPLLARYEGEKNDPSSFAFFFAGLIGLSAYQAISLLSKRVSELERQADVKQHVQTSNGDEGVK